MIVFPGLSLSAVGVSSILTPYSSNNVVQFGQNNSQPITSLGLIATVSPGANLIYSVQITGDQVPNANGNWNLHDVLFNKTTSFNSNILYGVSGVRLTVTNWVSGSVYLGVVQWP